MVYKILKLIVRIALRLFFQKIVVNKKAKLPEDGPVIVVVNHPNTFMDPLIVASLFRRQIGFLGNASIFINSTVRAIFRYFNVIPVYRQKDVEQGAVPDNTDSFQACYDYLGEGNALMIFPEGSSYHELKLRKIKTGTARIALGAEQQHGFQLGLKILPVGLYYNNPAYFRSKIYINIDEPIDVGEYIEAFEADEVGGVQKLTERIKEALTENVIHTEDKEEETLFVNIKRIYKSRLMEKTGEPDASQEFRLNQELVKAIRYFRISNESTFHQIKQQVEQYIRTLNESRLSGTSGQWLSGRTKALAFSLFYFSYLVLGLPLFIFGTAQNYLPYKIPYWTARKLTPEIEYHAPIMLTVGIFTFPVFYSCLAYGLYVYGSQDALILSVYLLLLPLSGFYCLHYLDFLELVRDFIKLNPLFKQQDSRIAELQALKSNLTDMLDEARDTYLKRL